MRQETLAGDFNNECIWEEKRKKKKKKERKAIKYPKCKGKSYLIFKIIRGQKSGSKRT